MMMESYENGMWILIIFLITAFIIDPLKEQLLQLFRVCVRYASCSP